MARTLDFDALEAKWIKDIKGLKDKVTEYEKAIEEQNVKKQKANEEIEKLNRFLSTAREMLGLNKSDLAETTKAQKIPVSNERFARMTLKNAIREILKAEPQRKFTGLEISNILLDGGYKSESPNYRTIVYNTMRSMIGKYIKVDKRDFEHKYMFLEESDKEDNMMFRQK